jgi:uncharacterized membrane protein YccC
MATRVVESKETEPIGEPSAPVSRGQKNKRKLSGEKLRAARKAERMAQKRAARQASAQAANEAANPSKQRQVRSPSDSPEPAANVKAASNSSNSSNSAKRRIGGEPRGRSQSSSRVPPRPPKSGGRTPATRVAIAAMLAVGLMFVFWLLFRMPGSAPR